MRHRHLDVGVLADRHAAAAKRLAVNADVQLGAGFAAAAQIVHPQAHGGPLPDNGEAGGVQHRQLAVAFLAPARHQHLQRGFQTHGLGRRRIMHLAVGDQHRARHAPRRHIGQRRIQCRKGLGAVVLAGGGGGDAGFTDDQVRLLRQQPPDRGARGFGLLGALAQAHALGAIRDDHRHVGQRGVLLPHQQRPGECKQQHRKGQPAGPGAPRAHIEGINRDKRRRDRQHHQQFDGDHGCKSQPGHRRFSVPSRFSRSGACTTSVL